MEDVQLKRGERGPMSRWFYIDTRWAAGGIKTDEDGKVISTPPILSKLIGQNVEDLKRHYHLLELNPELEAIMDEKEAE